jgi:hypothetical protein
LIIEDSKGRGVWFPGERVSDRKTEAVSGLFGMRWEDETNALKYGLFRVHSIHQGMEEKTNSNRYTMIPEHKSCQQSCQKRQGWKGMFPFLIHKSKKIS